MARWLVVFAIAACSRASDEGDNKQWPKPQPGAVQIPAGASIEVLVDGVAKPPITAKLLAATKPDFADEERAAWMIPKLVADAGPAGVVEAFGTNGISVTYPRKPDVEAVLFLTRRGDLNVEAVDPKDPFPRFHGKGGRLHRVGDSLPHVEKVVRLEITHPK